MEFTTVQAMDQQHLAQTYARFPVCLVEGQGAECKDTAGKTYIDFTSGIGVNSLGFCHPDWAAALCKQAQTLNHISNLYYTLPSTLLAQKLCEKSGLSRVFFGNSGAEANEGMIKAARKYSFDKYGKNRYEIISLSNSFHGRTLATLTATGQEGYHTFFDPFPEGFLFATPNDIESVKALITDKTCGILMELIQGEGGVVPLERAFVEQVSALCKEKDILLLLDEVQTGIGRTGSLFCYQQYGLSPDIVSAAKGLGGGLPIGAVLFGEKTQNTLTPGTHGTTFGGNPLASAGANVVLDLLDDRFLQEVKEKGDYVKAQAQKLPKVAAVHGMGLMIGIAFDGIEGKDVVNKCLEKGILFLTAKHNLRMLPPLIISKAEIDQGLSVLNDVLSHWEES